MLTDSVSQSRYSVSQSLALCLCFGCVFVCGDWSPTGGPCRVSRMPCEGCGAQFGLVRRRRACPACWRAYCGACLRRGAGRCEPCSVLSSRPLLPVAAAEQRIRDLQLFLRRRGVDTSRCLGRYLHLPRAARPPPSCCSYS